MSAESQTYTLPSTSHGHSSTSAGPRRSKKSWQNRLSLPSRKAQQVHTESEEQMNPDDTNPSHHVVPSDADRWWKIQYFQGMTNDIKRRAPYYWSDWADAWDYRVVPATVYMYFAKYVHHNQSSPDPEENYLAAFLVFLSPSELVSYVNISSTGLTLP